MAKNLYRLLQLSNLVPPECQLDSGEIEWSGEVPIEGGNKNVDMYKGLYLQSEDVRIKVIRSVNMKDENTVKVCLSVVRNLRSGQGKTRYTILWILQP